MCFEQCFFFLVKCIIFIGVLTTGIRNTVTI